MRGCWEPNVNFIFWPHCYDRHVVSCSPDVGVHSIGAFRGPFGRVWLSLLHLVSNSLGVCWQLLWGFPTSPSVGCGLPYHISSLTLWESAGNCFGGFRGPPRSGVAFPTTSGLYCLEFYWQLLWGFPRSPEVGCGLPYHISSLTLWESAGNCFGSPNSTELNNNSTPTRSPTGSLNRMFNRHQAEITVMQLRGYSLPVHDCNGTMRPSPCPIS